MTVSPQTSWVPVAIALNPEYCWSELGMDLCVAYYSQLPVSQNTAFTPGTHSAYLPQNMVHASQKAPRKNSRKNSFTEPTFHGHSKSECGSPELGYKQFAEDQWRLEISKNMEEL